MKNGKVSVLITGAGGTTGQSIIKSLHLSKLDCRIIGADANPYSAGLYRVDVGCILPRCYSTEYLEAMVELIAKEEVGIVLIGSTPEVPVLAGLSTEIESRTGARVVVSAIGTVEMCFDKLLTCRWLEKLGMACPRFCARADVESVIAFAREIGFPVIVKPRKGTSGKGFQVVRSEQQLVQAVAATQDPIVQEYLLPDDEEYTCGAFYDRTGKCKGIIALKRELKVGETYRAIVEPFDEIKAGLRPVADSLDARGGINFQLRRTKDGVKVFEINPRFSSSTAIMSYYGFNAPEAAVRSFALGEEVKEMGHRSGVALRFTDEIYVDPADVRKLSDHGVLGGPKSIRQQYL